jgi:hypothetical protein
MTYALRLLRFYMGASVLILCACGSGSSGFDEVGQTSGEESVKSECKDVITTPYALWSEFLSVDEVISIIPVLYEKGIALYQAIPADMIGDKDIARLLGEVSCNGVELRAWLTLPNDQGYWPNEKNAWLFSEKALKLAGWIKQSGWDIDWIVVDMEPDFSMMNSLFEALGSGRLIEAFELLKDNHDPEMYEASVDVYEKLVDDLHALGFKVMVVTFPMVLDDMHDGDSSIQDLLNIPVTRIDWDMVSFMTYTTIFEMILGSEVSEYLVYSYGQDAVKFFGDRAAVELGIIGGGGMIDNVGITDLGKLERQVDAAKYAGVKAIHAYSLDGILGLDENDKYFDIFKATAHAKPETQISVKIIRSALKFVDRFIE